MLVRVQKWGNSLALRIPKSFGVETRLKPGSLVNLSLRGHSIIISPVSARYSLDELLSRVNESNIHGELSTNNPVGKESW